MRGYKEEGTTTTPFDIVMLNDLDRCHLVMDVIDRRDLMRCISREDALVAADVRHRLDLYSGPGRWTVTARAGAVTITDDRDLGCGDPTDRHVAHVLAAAVPGVSSVQVHGAGDSD